MAGGENNDIRKKARASTKSHGFRNGDDDVDVDMNWPPIYGHYIDNTSAVQVEVEYTHDTFFLGIVGMDTLTYSANATALVGGEANENCVYVLGEDNVEKMFYLSSSPSSLIATCGIVANLKGSSGLYMDSDTHLEATTIETMSNKHNQIEGKVKCTGTDNCLAQMSAPASDPLEGLELPMSTGSCSSTKKITGGSKDNPKKVTAGDYCKGLELDSGYFEMDPGTYVMEKGDFIVSNGANVTGDGVTIVSHCSSDCQNPIGVQSGSTLDLSAPKCSSGGCVGTEGILFWSAGDKETKLNDDEKPIVTFESGSNVTLDGVVYAPKHNMEFSSGSVGGLDSNVILISKYLTLSSGSQVTLNRPADDMNP
ncbi:von willebrand factor type A domain protein [Vibrio ishigakensis]|uniref:von willebrand factor type A domain protein n=1 Tax=Vibrio ishigakensis TaxID=1481914 RepID=A0A0B8PAK0_9VIBR|nr:von willebrand factor type A domain protein [Vibrio ishigakensis]